jgi:hypothetical protein
MGHLDQPLNTFWQLFYRPAGAKAWSNQASALAVATNGGIVVSSDGAASIVVGIRPTNYLGFSPLIATFDARSWSPESPIGALVDVPDSLALGSGGDALALVSNGKASELVSRRGSLGRWRTLATMSGLASSRAGRACGMASLSAVGYLGADALVGAACRRAGAIGLFTPAGGSWRGAGLVVPSGLHSSGSDVLGFAVTTDGLCALVELTVTTSTDLIGECASDGGSSWRVSGVLPVKGSTASVSLGPTAGVGMFALVTASSKPARLVVLTASDMEWTELASPPAGTATVAFAGGGGVDALAVNDTLFTDWRLRRDGRGWQSRQRIRVPIEFGSSS